MFELICGCVKIQYLTSVKTHFGVVLYIWCFQLLKHQLTFELWKKNNARGLVVSVSTEGRYGHNWSPPVFYLSLWVCLCVRVRVCVCVFFMVIHILLAAVWLKHMTCVSRILWCLPLCLSLFQCKCLVGMWDWELTVSSVVSVLMLQHRRPLGRDTDRLSVLLSGGETAVSCQLKRSGMKRANSKTAGSTIEEGGEIILQPPSFPPFLQPPLLPSVLSFNLLPSLLSFNLLSFLPSFPSTSSPSLLSFRPPSILLSTPPPSQLFWPLSGH